MRLTELKALRRTVEALAPVRERHDHPVLAPAFDDLLARFRKGVFLAGNRLVAGRLVEAELADDLHCLAEALIEMRRKLEAQQGAREG